MQPWQPNPQIPVQLPICADARIVPLEYTNDHTWELCLGGGDPPAVSLQTTYGLRARQMRLFFQFIFERSWVADPQDYVSTPEIQAMYPNFIRLFARPADGLEVRMDFWCPASTLICGRIKFSNTTSQTLPFVFRIAAQLTPLEEGERIANRQAGINQILSGKAGNLFPVLFITGGPEPSSGAIPGLDLDLQLSPESSRLVTWCLASEASMDVSLDKARKMTATDWESNLARIEQLDRSSVISITSGDPALDLAVRFSQIRAASFLMRSPKFRSDDFRLIANRLPDTGYSRRGDGSDFPDGWKAVTTLDLTHFVRCASPGNSDICAGMMKSYLSASSDGLPAFRHGDAGLFSKYLAQPTLLAAIACLTEEDQNKLLTPAIVKTLSAYLTAWFNQDGDQDGWPEWQTPTQTGFNLPIFDRHLPTAQSAPPQLVETPVLAGLLLNEIRLLLKLSQTHPGYVNQEMLTGKAKRLSAAMCEYWKKNRRFGYQHSQYHMSPASLILARTEKEASIRVRKKLGFPQPLLVRALTDSGETCSGVITVSGKDASGQPQEETISLNRIPWLNGRMLTVTRNTFSQIERCTISRIRPKTAVEVSTIDFSLTDGTCWFPLLSPDLPAEVRLPALEQLEAKILEEDGLSPYDGSQENDLQVSSPFFSAWIIDLLLDQKKSALAVKIWDKIATFSARAFQQTGCLWSEYRHKDGKPAGEKNGLYSLLPIQCFLRILGIENLSGDQVLLNGLSAYPEEITLRYRLWQIKAGPSGTTVQYGANPPVSVNSPGNYRIVLGKTVV